MRASASNTGADEPFQLNPEEAAVYEALAAEKSELTGQRPGLPARSLSPGSYGHSTVMPRRHVIDISTYQLHNDVDLNGAAASQAQAPWTALN